MTKRMSGVRIALDGPSALAFYRDRCKHESASVPWYASGVHISANAMPELANDGLLSDEDFWLSDEDVAQTLAESSVFGKRERVVGYTNDDFASESEPLQRTRVNSLARCAAYMQDVKQLPLERLGVRAPTSESPLYLMVGEAFLRTRASNLNVRVCGNQLPQNAFYRLGTHILMPTPEFTFLLLANYLSLRELVIIGMELCGYYRLIDGNTDAPLQSTRTLYSQRPLTTVSRLKAFLEQMKGFSGARDALRACKFIEQGSASPMETALYLLLCLPRALGGYALPHPILNGKRAVNKRAQPFTFADYLIPDLYWPAAKLDLEYDSEAFHASSESLRNGARRALALRAMKVEMISLTGEVAHDAKAFDAVARLVARKTKKRLRPETADFIAQRAELRQMALLARNQRSNHGA